MSKKDKRGLIILVLFMFGLVTLVYFVAWIKQGLSIEEIGMRFAVYGYMIFLFCSLYFILPLLGKCLIFLEKFVGSSKNKSDDEDEDLQNIMNVIKSMDRESKIETLENKIFDLKCKRGNIVTTNGWRTGSDKLSPSQLEHNWKRVDYLDQQIEELQEQIRILKNR